MGTQGYHRADIKASLEKIGLTLRDIARAVGVNPNGAHRVLWAKWGTMEREISLRLGVTVERLWPERYAPPPPVRSGRDRRGADERRRRRDRRRAA